MGKNQPQSTIRFSLDVYLTLGVSLVFVVAAVFLIDQVIHNEREQALIEAKAKSQLILDRNLATHRYFSSQLKPKVFELTDPYRSNDYFEPSWMSSTYAVREIYKQTKAIGNVDYYYKECAVNARNPWNEADEFERAFIKELNADPKLQYRSLIRNLNGAYYYVTLRRGEVLEEACLQCHSTPDRAPKGLIATYGSQRSFNRKVGEVISAISIRVPLSGAYAQANRFAWHLAMLLIATFCAIFLIQYLIYRQMLYTPIKMVRNKAIQISENDRCLGEEIPLPVSCELGDLASSFNTMSQKIRHQMDTLEEKVEARTSELKDANEKLKNALDQVKQLSGFLPICASCKKIRDDKGYWRQIETYIHEHSEAKFSHGICPECAERLYPEFNPYK